MAIEDMPLQPRATLLLCNGLNSDQSSVLYRRLNTAKDKQVYAASHKV